MPEKKLGVRHSVLHIFLSNPRGEGIHVAPGSHAVLIGNRVAEAQK
jgi:hypothetical protein